MMENCQYYVPQVCIVVHKHIEAIIVDEVWLGLADINQDDLNRMIF